MKHASVFKSFLLLVSLSVLFSSCGRNTNSKNNDSADFVMGEDSQYMFHAQGLNLTMAATEDGYYLLIHDYIFYADKDTMKPTVLCNKPDCLHEKETDSNRVFYCNAFAKSGLSNNFLALYKDKLYVISGFDNAQQKEQPQLVSISLDGTNRKTEFLLPLETSSMALHRGYFYYVRRDNENPEESYSRIMRHELGKSQTQEEGIFTSNIQGGYIQDLIGRGDQLYFNEYGGQDETFVSRALLYDSKTKGTKRIFTEDDNYTASSPRIVENRLYSSLFNLKEDNNYSDSELFSTDLQGNDMREEFLAPSLNSSCLDQNYLYGCYPGTGPEDLPEIARVDFYDHSGNLKDSVEFPNARRTIRFAPGDDRYIFLQYEDETYTYIDLIDKKEIGSKNIKPISFFKMETSFIGKSIIIKIS